MRRKALAAMLVLLSAALVLGGNALLDAADDRGNVQELQLIFFGAVSATVKTTNFAIAH